MKSIWLMLALLGSLASQADHSRADEFIRCKTQQTTASGEKWSGTLVLSDPTTHPIRGYFDWHTSEKIRLLELVSGTYDTQSRQLRLRTSEMRSSSVAYSLCDYEATLDLDAKKITNGKKTNPADREQSIEWSGTVLPSSDVKFDKYAETWMTPTSERSQLLRELSDGYQIKSAVLLKRPSIELLRPLTASNDIPLANMAKVAVAISQLYELSLGQTDLSDEVRLFQLEMLRFTLSELATTEPTATDSLRNAVNVFTQRGGAFHIASQRYAEGMRKGPEIQAQQNAMRLQLKEYLRSTSPMELAGKVGVDYRIGQAGYTITHRSPVSVVLKNLTGGALTGVCIVIDINVDSDLLAQAVARQDQEWAIAGGIQSLLGVDPEITVNREEGRALYAKTKALGFGSMVFVEQWPPGSEVIIYADSVGNMESIVDRMNILVASDSGHLPEQTVLREDFYTVIVKKQNDQIKAIRNKAMKSRARRR